MTGELTAFGAGAVFTTAAVGYFTTKPERTIQDPRAVFHSERQKAYLFMNRMWDQVEKRS